LAGKNQNLTVLAEKIQIMAGKTQILSGKLKDEPFSA
jgi:hypothetical protein